MISLSGTEDLVAAEAPPESPMEVQQGMTGVMAALGALPKNQQEVIRLKFQNGMSYKDISRITGHSVTNVGVLIHTGIKTLRKNLKGGAQ